jgi:hypothetical protein
LPGHGWTLKKLGRWVQRRLGRTVGQTSLRRIVRAAGLRWKKCKKLLRKASACQRAAYMERFEALWARMRQGDVTVVYVDESHFHQDLDVGYTWATTGKPAWRVSNSPPLSARINWYGAYDFTHGQAMIWHEGKCNSEQTIHFLQRLHDWQGKMGQGEMGQGEMGQGEMGQGAHKGAHKPIVVIWDGAPWHRSLAVRRQAQHLGIELIPLPAYSPDLNPIEGLWKWMRTEVTQHHCHASLDALSLDCQAFITSINQAPQVLVDRLWPRFELDPDYEKLLLST